MDKVKQIMYYLMVGFVSLLALTFLPMIGSDPGLGWSLPNTTVGWIVWVVVKLIVAALNILIFYCFMEQAKLNVRENNNYKAAREILIKQKGESIPRSAAKWQAQQYSQKGVAIFITSGLSVVALTQAVLTYDYVAMLTYLFTIIMGVIFGIIQMKNAEDYWTNEYYAYALFVQNGGLEKKNDKHKRKRVQKSDGTGVEESTGYCEDSGEQRDN